MKIKRQHKHLLASAIVFSFSTTMLFGCLGITEETEGVVEPEELVSLLSSSNKAVNGHPGLWGNDADTTVRFDTSSDIPVYYVSNGGGMVPDVIRESVNVMSNQLGIRFSEFVVLDEDLSQYRDSNYPNQNVGNYRFNKGTFQSRHGINGGIVFAIDTAFYSHQYSFSPSTMCANASHAPYDGGMAIDIDSNTQTYRSDTLLWVNLGNRQCSWDKAIVLHEMAHVLGLFQHFEYYGSWNTTSMAVLKLLYRNHPGTPFHSLSL